MKKQQKQKKNLNIKNLYNVCLKILCVIILGSIIFSLIIHIVHSIQNKTPFFDFQWSVGEMFGFLGSMVLGAVAIYQNKKMQNVNDRLLSIEENKLIPGIALTNITLKRYEELKKQSFPIVCGDNDNKGYAIYKNDEIHIDKQADCCYFEIRNVKDVDIIDIGPTCLTQTLYDENNNIIEKKKNKYWQWILIRLY